MAAVDEISPAYYGEDRIRLSLAPGQTPRQFEAVLVDVDYSECEPEGVVLPLEMLIVQESGEATFQRTTFSRLAPNQLAFVPREGGSCLVRLAEKHHNRWFGAVQIDVTGELVAKR